MPKFTGALVQHPARVAFAWYAAIIACGTVVLCLPLCSGINAKQAPISMLDGCFTATSALCVTGLTVRSTSHDFSFLGQVAILALIQMGGIGIMTVTTFVTFNLGGSESLRHRAIISETLGAGPATDLRWVLRRVLLATLFVEGACASLMAGWFAIAYHYPLRKALWYGVFHSISAFCNAGFGLEDDSLIPFQGDWLINTTIMLLIVVGGIGFPVILDISRNWHGSLRDRWDRLLLHSKLMLLGTASLIVGGTVAFWVLESEGVLAAMPWHQQLLVALFQSVTPRTAGFNSVNYGELTNATLLVTMLLMMIGAGPCSTGGGFKVSTLAVMAVRAWNTFHGRERVQLFRRSIPPQSVEKSVATASLYSVVAMVGLTLLLVIEQSATQSAGERRLFVAAAFETISALGTVGLSTGLTTELSPVGRCIIIVLMFMGRLGPFTVFIALARGERSQAIEYASEEPLIG